MVARYLLLGAGGTGSHLIDPLLRYLTHYHGNSEPDTWQIAVMDGDALAAKNLVRQLFAPQEVLANKAEALVRAHAYMGNVYAVPEYLGEHNIANFVSDEGTVLIAVDNFKVRSLIEKFGLTLPNLTVINGGNETSTGSCQIWLRKDGENLTPPLSFLHPELGLEDGDRSQMSCEEIEKLPGGEQIIAVNGTSAMMMLSALIAVHRNQVTWTEVQFDIFSGLNVPMDQRERRGWKPEPVEIQQAAQA